MSPQESLYEVLANDPDVTWVRDRTARRATQISRLAEEQWGDLGTPEERQEATAGVIAAGSFARPVPLPDTPPLLSVRMHGFFLGLPGLWACSDPKCPAVPPEFRGPDRPVGKLYADPRPWCECGARVLELFSCRKCGLLFLGGVPDKQEGLWPWRNERSSRPL